MFAENDGAIVLVYKGGLLSNQLYHEHDGGSSYSMPLIKQAIRYAKTHYESGDIVKVLKSEVEFELGEETVGSTVHCDKCRHLYYVTARYNKRKERTEYEAYYSSSAGLGGLYPFPEIELGIPCSAVKIA